MIEAVFYGIGVSVGLAGGVLVALMLWWLAWYGFLHMWEAHKVRMDVIRCYQCFLKNPHLAKSFLGHELESKP